MAFPKTFMTIKELAELGLSEKILRKMFHKYGYPLAFRESQSKTAPIKFNTLELGKVLSKENRGRE